MYEVLKSFTTATRRFSPDLTPVIGPDDLAGCAMPLDHMVAKGFIGPSKAAEPAPAVADEPAVGDAPMAPRQKKS